MNRRQTGSYYEEVAVRYLQEQQYQIVARNFRCRIGEIDVIARDGAYLVFVEVKYRSSLKKGYPAEAVTRSKQQTIYRVAAWYLQSQGYAFNVPCRFDVVSICGQEITLLKNAFGGF